MKRDRSKPRERRKGYLTPKQMAFVANFAGDAAEAGRLAGFSPRSVPTLMKNPQVLEALKKKQEEAIKKSADRLIEQNRQIEEEQRITKARLVQRLWTLASLGPDATNGTITGQVKAADSIGEMMGYKIQLRADLTKEFEGRSETELEFFAQHGYWPNSVDPDQSRPN